MDSKKQKKENALVKSHSLAIEKTPVNTQPVEIERNGKPAAQTYNFLATLRKVKRLNTENVQKIYKLANIVVLAANSRTLCRTASSITDCDSQN